MKHELEKLAGEEDDGGLAECTLADLFPGQASTDLAPSYAALILADDGVEITVCNLYHSYIVNTHQNNQQSEKILALTNAANVEVEPIWASLLAKALEGKDVKELLSNVGAGGGAPAAGAAVGGGAAAAGGAAPEAAKEEAKEEEKEESDDDMVCLICYRSNHHTNGSCRVSGCSTKQFSLSFFRLLHYLSYHNPTHPSRCIRSALIYCANQNAS